MRVWEFDWCLSNKQSMNNANQATHLTILDALACPHVDLIVCPRVDCRLSGLYPYNGADVPCCCWWHWAVVIDIAVRVPVGTGGLVAGNSVSCNPKTVICQFKTSKWTMFKFDFVLKSLNFVSYIILQSLSAHGSPISISALAVPILKSCIIKG